MSDIDNTFFERVLAKHAMTDATYLSSIADYVKPEYFEDKNIAKYFHIVNEFYDKRGKLPTFTEVKTYLTTDSLKAGFKKLLESFKELEVGNKEELYENTELFLKEKGLYHAILESAESISEGKGDSAEIVEAFEKIAGINLNLDKGFELYGDSELMFEDILSTDTFISSGWKWVDDAIGGGFRERGKALYMFAGQANIGKSIFLGNVAANIAEQNKTVLVISLEMSEMLYAQRISSNITKIPMSSFKHEVPTLRQALKENKQKLPKSKIFIKEFPPSTITPKQLAAFIKKLKDSGEEIDAIVIDYISLLHSTQGVNSYERGKYICEQVRAMSYIFGCPIISAAQLGRQVYNTDNPGMEGIAESISVAQTADVIWSIFQSEEDLELKLIKLGLMKNRFGARGMIQAMKIDYSTLSVFQADEEEEMMNEDEISLLESLIT
jgi:replicative DNA helicase